MTKNIDPPPPLHIGVRLHRAYEAWLVLFVAAMQQEGHAWFTLGRANVMGVMDRSGTRQSELLVRTGLTKQALQQMLDGMERHDIVVRTVDPADKRGRLVQLTDKGHAALADADRIKQDIAKDFEGRLGSQALANLESLLDQLVQP